MTGAAPQSALMEEQNVPGLGLVPEDGAWGALVLCQRCPVAEAVWTIATLNY